MPKLKSHKAAGKRMKLLKSGKIVRGKAGKSHLNSSKSGKKIRQLRKKTLVNDTAAKIYTMMLKS